MRHVKVKTVFATHTHSNANLGKKSTIYIKYAKCVHCAQCMYEYR